MKRKNIPKKVQLNIWRRDCWGCRYCGEPVFFSPSLKIFHELSPNCGYYHPNGKNGEMLPLFQWKWASIDHILPFSKGGIDSEDNYVTACWKCNLSLNDSSSEQGKPKPKEVSKHLKKIGWDGFSSLYPKLSKRKDSWHTLLKK